MDPALVVLAAGMGSRFGGLKQLQPVGPNEATIMDYTVYDARRAGYGSVVFVIRRDMASDFNARYVQRFQNHIEVRCAYQTQDALPGVDPPPDRIKPWGTGHAVLAASKAVSGPFAVVNADDFYGAASFTLLAEFGRQAPEHAVPIYALVSYALSSTLSNSGAVFRGLCRSSPDGWLEHIVERRAIERRGPDGACRDESGALQTISGQTRVSMNMWGFTPEVFVQLRERFDGFLQEHGSSTTSEFLLPSAIADLIESGQARVRVLDSGATWCGMTHPSDQAVVTAIIHELVDRGHYPVNLWG